MYTFDGGRVLIVGGSSGIGHATAKAFAAAGAKVTIAARSADKLNRVAAELGVEARQLDVTEDDAVVRFFRGEAPWRHIVVSGASTKSGPARSMSLEDAYAAMNSKFWGAYRIARVAQIEESGSLTLTSGFLSHKPSAASVLQGAINAALEALARGLALELSPVRVNTVSPGMIATPLWDSIPPDKRREMYAAVAAKLPAKRVGAADDVANAILFLAATPFATGSTIFIDGGGSIA